MASIRYLWKHRAKFPLNSKGFYKCWAKRGLTFFELLKRNRRRYKLNFCGALIDQTAEIGKLKIMGPKNKLKIGGNCFIGQIHIALHEEVIIGNNVCINDGVQILTASHDVLDSSWQHKKKSIIIADYAWIATNAILLPGARIGKGAVIGAGAVVSKEVLPYQIVVGNPAIPITKQRCQTLNYNPCEFLAANSAWLKC